MASIYTSTKKRKKETFHSIHQKHLRETFSPSPREMTSNDEKSAWENLQFVHSLKSAGCTMTAMWRMRIAMGDKEMLKGLFFCSMAAKKLRNDLKIYLNSIREWMRL